MHGITPELAWILGEVRLQANTGIRSTVRIVHQACCRDATQRLEL